MPRRFPELQHGAEVRRILLDLDTKAAAKIWRTLFPLLPVPKTSAEILWVLHAARTQAKHLPLKDRIYSQKWLDERQTTRIVPAVGIAIGTTSALMKNLAEDLGGTMADVVVRAHKEGIALDYEADEVAKRMASARAKFLDRVTIAVRDFMVKEKGAA